MTKSQIQYFLAVAKEKSISKASEQLFVSQPAVSKQISLLEEELGVDLFSRRSHGLDITPAGQAFEKLFIQFQLMFKETLEIAKSGNTSLQGTYHLGFTDGWALPPFCLDLFSSLSEKYPQLDFDITSFTVDQIYYALKRGEADSVITIENLFKEYPDLSTEHLTTIDAILLFSQNHPLAKKPNLTLKDFSESIFFVATPVGLKYGVYDLLGACVEAGFAPHIEHVSSIHVIYNNIQAGKGVFLTNDWIMAKKNPIFKYIKLDYRLSIGIATYKDHSSHLNSVVKQEIINYASNSPYASETD